jgi:hypothetical protein
VLSVREGEGSGLPDQSKSSHANRLEVGIPDIASVKMRALVGLTIEPRGDLEGGSKDLGAHEFGHYGRVGRAGVVSGEAQRATRMRGIAKARR